MEQWTILNNPNNKRIVITGKPDTGKTLLLKTKAMELLNANVNTKILYVINPQNPRRVLDLDVSQIRNRQKTKKKKYVNMHMQTKFFLWEGLVELLLWKLRTIFIFVKKKSLSDSFKFLGRLKQV